MSQPIANTAVLNVALQLTDQEDQVALRRVLLAGVGAVPHVNNVALFEMKSDLKEAQEGELFYRNALESDAQFTRLEQRSSMLQAFHRQEIVRDEIESGEAHTHRYVIPIQSSGVISELLSVESCELSDADFESIRFLSEIYRNYTQLLHKYERDALTGLLNRRSFEERLSHYMEQLAEVYSADMEKTAGGAIPHLAVLDIDHFKRINDNYGHLYGDDVLLLFSNQMREQFSAETSLYRFGGEEFVVVMNASDRETAQQLENFRRAIEQFDFPQVGQVTVSIGYTAVPGSSVSSEIIDRADQALYFAKEHGRNRVCSYEELVDAGQIEPKQQQDGGEIELF